MQIGVTKRDGNMAVERRHRSITSGMKIAGMPGQAEQQQPTEMCEPTRLDGLVGAECC